MAARELSFATYGKLTPTIIRPAQAQGVHKMPLDTCASVIRRLEEADGAIAQAHKAAHLARERHLQNGNKPDHWRH